MSRTSCLDSHFPQLPIDGSGRFREVLARCGHGLSGTSACCGLHEGEGRPMANQLMESSECSRQPAGSCRLYLVRHGTTTLNVENRYRGRRDIPLDAQGYQDAVDVARCLSGAGLAAVYTSP